MSIHFHAECIDQRCRRGTFGRNAGVILKKCKQKCLDVNKRLKSEKKMADQEQRTRGQGELLNTYVFVYTSSLLIHPTKILQAS